MFNTMRLQMSMRVNASFKCILYSTLRNNNEKWFALGRKMYPPRMRNATKTKREDTKPNNFFSVLRKMSTGAGVKRNDTASTA